jgi:hypothetical protein
MDYLRLSARYHKMIELGNEVIRTKKRMKKRYIIGN